MNTKDKLIQYSDAGYPIIYINSFEETKTDTLIKEIMGGRKGLQWNVSHNFVNMDGITIDENIELPKLLKMLCNDQDELNRRYLVIKDIHLFLDDPIVVSTLKDIALQIAQGLDTVIFFVSPIIKIPKELEKFITIVEMEFPSQAEIKRQICNFAAEQCVSISDSLLEEMSLAFKGLTEFEIDNLLASALASTGSFSRNDLKLIFEQKKQMIMKSGILEMIDVKEKSEDIGGLENLKEWLDRKSKIFKNINKAEEFGVSLPKGVLIAGVPGCGKSLTAKVTSQLFEVPLLRLDMGRIFGKYVGESEENMRRAIALAEAISPCILWVDELEKAFAGINGSGNEVTVRLFGTFLTWMQEKKSPAFVVATANDITKLPPELLRKGRFDEIFYVGLPNNAERRKIFEIHINKRRSQDMNNIDIDSLVSITKGYSGADIEGVVTDAVESAFIDGIGGLTTEHIQNAINNTHSLSEIMKGDIDKLSTEYKNRKFKSASV